MMTQTNDMIELQIQYANKTFSRFALIYDNLIQMMALSIAYEN